MPKWPSAQDYALAIQNPAYAFADKELCTSAPELNRLRLPRPRSGTFAVVYQVHHASGRAFAVRCLTREVTGQDKRYAAISRSLHGLKSEGWVVGFTYQTRGIKVAGNWYPIVKMDWVVGVGLDRWIMANMNGPSLQRMAADFFNLCSNLKRARVGHGDLSHGNIMVENGRLRLVDYDGLYVPALAGSSSGEVGHPNYQHPDRGSADYGPGIDHFSAWVIYGSLVALSADQTLWGECGAGDDCLLLVREDFRDLASSPRIGLMRASSNATVRAVADAWLRCLSLPVSKTPELEDLLGQAGASPGPGTGGRVSGATPWWQVPGTSGTPGVARRPRWYPLLKGLPGLGLWRSIRASASRSTRRAGGASVSRPDWLYGKSAQSTMLGSLRIRAALVPRAGVRQAAALAAILTVVSVVIVVATSGHHGSADRPAQSATSDDAGSSSGLSPGEQGIVAHVPAALQSACVSNAPNKLPGSFASVACNDGPVYATFDRFPTGRALSSRYRSYKSDYGLDAGWCRNYWGRSTSYGPRGENVTQGYVMCYYGRKGYVWMDWTNIRTHIYGYAMRKDGARKRLFRWWSSVGSQIQ